MNRKNFEAYSKLVKYELELSRLRVNMVDYLEKLIKNGYNKETEETADILFGVDELIGKIGIITKDILSGEADRIMERKGDTGFLDNAVNTILATKTEIKNISEYINSAVSNM